MYLEIHFNSVISLPNRRPNRRHIKVHKFRTRVLPCHELLKRAYKIYKAVTCIKLYAMYAKYV